MEPRCPTRSAFEPCRNPSIELRQGSGQTNHVCFIKPGYRINVRSCPHVPVGDNSSRTDGQVIDAMSIQRLEYS
jgi:hypothetical protein